MNKKTQPQTNALALTNMTVPDVLVQIDKALGEQETIRTTTYRTGGLVEGFSTNLKDEKEVANVIRMFSKILASEKAYNDSIRALGLNEAPVFTFKGCIVEDWKIDCQLRISIITMEDRSNKLEKAKSIVSQFLSEADKRTAALADVSKLLGISIVAD
jgi:hypothetical protein